MIKHPTWFHPLSAGTGILILASALTPLMAQADVGSLNCSALLSTPTQWQQLPLSRAVASTLTNIAHPRQVQSYRFHDDHVLGTSLDVIAVAANREMAQSAMKAVQTEIARLDAILSTYRQDSELNALNTASSATVSQELFDVVQACEKWRMETGDAFSPRLGAVFRVWHAAAASGVALDPVQLRGMVEQLSKTELHLDTHTRTISRPDGVIFALDALAKGYIIDAALNAVRMNVPALSGLMIDIGGDVRCWGQASHPEGWHVGIADPMHSADNAPPVAIVKLGNKAIATSGKGARDVHVAGCHYSHIVSPQSGWATDHIISATVIADKAADADALATAFTVMPPEQSLALANRLPGVETLLLTNDGRHHSSQGWHMLAAVVKSRPESMQQNGMMIQVAAAADSNTATTWPAGFNTVLDYEIPRIEADIYRSPYVAIWITDTDRQLVRTLLLLGDKPKYINENYVWWRRYGRKMSNLDTISKPTRAPGHYHIAWDGLDDTGQRVSQGRYLLHVEAVREHGGHTYQSFELDLAGNPVNRTMPTKDEIGSLTLRYGKVK
jgi:FAD:protein FMN transferase